MSSRLSIGTKGVQYAASPDNAGAMNQFNTFNNMVYVNRGLQALVGTTIRGQVVGAVERWADGTVWDTGNSRALYAGTDFNASVLLQP